MNRRGFYSLSCETYSGTVASTSGTSCPSGFYSLSCETYSGTSFIARLREMGVVSIRCRARRTAEPYPPRQAADQRERCPIAHPTTPSSNMCALECPRTAVCAGRRLAHPTGAQPHIATQARFVGFSFTTCSSSAPPIFPAGTPACDGRHAGRASPRS